METSNQQYSPPFVSEVVPNERTVCASAPGKVILFGEHAVVYGEPAVAAALSDLRIFVQITPVHSGTVRMILPDLPTPIDYTLPATKLATLDNLQTPPLPNCAAYISQLFVDDDGTTNTYIDAFTITALTPLVYLVQQLAPPEMVAAGLVIAVRSQALPVGAGLGSSAAFGVAAAAALVLLGSNNNINSISSSSAPPPPMRTGRPDEASLAVIDQYAYYSEILLHGTPSGIDNAVSSHGGAIHFTKTPSKGVSMRHLQHLAPLDLLLVYTHVPRSTKHLVGAVGDMRDTYPAVACMLTAMGLIAEQFQTWWCNSSATTVHTTNGDDSSAATVNVLTMVRTNQLLLKAVGVSHPSLDRICAVVDRVAGDQAAAKLTGAGGGGCAFVVLKPAQPDQLDALRGKIQQALREQAHPWKFTCLQSSVGGDGVLWLSPSDFPKAAADKRTFLETASSARYAALALLATGTCALAVMGLRRSAAGRR